MSTNKTLENCEMQILHSMSSFLHVMKTTINGSLLNPIYRLTQENDADEIHREIQENIYPAVLRMFSLCELINVLQEIMKVDSQSSDAIKRILFKTSLFKNSLSHDSFSLGQILGNLIKPEGVSLEISGDMETKNLLDASDIFGTNLFYEMLLSHMLLKIVDYSKREDGKVMIVVSNTAGVFRMQAKSKNILTSDWDENLIGTDQFKLFHLLLTKIGIARLEVKNEEGLVIIDLVISK